MMKANRRTYGLAWTLLTVALALTLMSGAGPAYGQGADGVTSAVPSSGAGPLATITFVSGAVGVWQDGGDAWAMVQGAYSLYMGDHVRTGDDSRAVIKFTDGSEVLMHEQTTLQITPRSPVDEPQGVAARVKVSLGRIFNRITPEQSDLEFETPDAVAAIRGTEFFVTVGPDFDVFFDAVRERALSAPLTVEESKQFLNGYVESLAAAGRIEEQLERAIQDVIDVVFQSGQLAGEGIRTVVDSVAETVHRALEAQGAREQLPRAAELSEEQKRLRERLERQVRQRIDDEAGGPTDTVTVPDLIQIVADFAGAEAGDGSEEALVLDWAAAFLEQTILHETGGYFGEFGPNSPPPLTFDRVRAGADGLDAASETVVLVLTGRVEVFNDLGAVLVEAGEKATAVQGRAPTDPMPADVGEIRDALGWVEELEGTEPTEDAGADPSSDGDEVFVPEPGAMADEDDPPGNVRVTMDVEPAEVREGERIAFRISVQNTGEEEVEALSLRVTLPPGFALDEESIEGMDFGLGDAWSIDLPGSPIYVEEGSELPSTLDLPVATEEVILPAGGYERVVTFDVDIGTMGEGPGVYLAEAYTYVTDSDEPLHTPVMAEIKVLEAESPLASITGRIVRGTAPVAGQSVALVQWEEGQSVEFDEPTVVARRTTNSQGEYTMAAGPGEYRIVLNDNYSGGSGVPPFTDPRIGDVTIWMSGPLQVGEDGLDVGDIELDIGYGVDFQLTVAMSEWSAPPGGPVTEAFAGGAAAGDDTFVLQMDDIINSDNPIAVEWSFDDVGFDRLSGARGTAVAVFDGVDYERAYRSEQADTAAKVVYFTEWPVDENLTSARLALAVELEDGSSFWALGPNVDMRNFPEVEAIEPVHVVHGEGAQLAFTFTGQNLDLVKTVWYAVDSVGVSGQMGFEAQSDGRALHVTFPWSLMEGVYGVYKFELSAGPNPEWTYDVAPTLLVTSTDLSGNGPGAVPQRGDLHRSAAGDGPIGELTREAWGNPDMISPIAKAPQFVGEYVIVQEMSDGGVLAYTLDGSGHEWHNSNPSGPLTVASSGDGDDRILYETGLWETEFYGLVAALPAEPSEVQGLYDVSDAMVHDVVVHKGIGVAVLSESDILRVVTFDAAAPGVVIAETELDVPPGDDVAYRLALAAGSPGQPRVFVVGDQRIWSGDLYTLQNDWFNESEGWIYDFALHAAGDELYVFQQRDGGVEVVAYDGATGAIRWEVTEEDVSDATQRSGLYSSRDSLALHPDGRLYVMAFGGGDTFLLEIDDGGIARVGDGPQYEVAPPDPRIGLGLAANSDVLYGFVSHGGDGEMFKVNLGAGEGSEPTDGLSVVPLAFEGGTSWGQELKFMTVARDAVWVVADGDDGSDGNVIFRLVGIPGTEDVIDPPLVKRADKARAQIGDVITYTITFDNTRLVDDEVALVDQDNVWIQDMLPPGFVFVEGSSYVYPTGSGSSDPVPLAPADSSTGRTLQFELTGGSGGGVIPRDTVRTLTYQAVVGPRVVEGAVYTNEAIGYLDGVDSVRGGLEWDNLCHAADPADPVTNPGTLPTDCDFILTNVARADVQIVPGVLTMQGIVVGKVFVDSDGDGFQGPDEPGVAGARIVMETGVSVIADSFGKFSLSNLTPGLHVFMLDETSVVLPENIGRGVGFDADSAPASDGGTPSARGWSVLGGAHRLIDLAGGGLFTVNFPVQPVGEVDNPADSPADTRGE